MGLRTPKLYINNAGAVNVRLTNRTGAASVKGAVVEVSSANDFSVITAGANVLDPVGVFLESGIPNGSEAWISTLCIIEGLYDAGGASRDYWCGTGGTAGRIDGTNASPPSATTHFQEMGHALTAAPANSIGSLLAHYN